MTKLSGSRQSWSRHAAVGLSAALAVLLAVLVGGHRSSVAADVDKATTEANITRIVTSILGESQLAHHPLDEQLAGKLLERYLEALDGNRSLFLQSDVDQFAAY